MGSRVCVVNVTRVHPANTGDPVPRSRGGCPQDLARYCAGSACDRHRWAPRLTSAGEAFFSGVRADEIQSVKQQILAQSETIGEKLDTHPSTFVAVSSLVWTSIVHAKNLDPAVDAYYMVPVDLCRRLVPPVDERYFGNSVAPAAVRDLRDDGASLPRRGDGGRPTGWRGRLARDIRRGFQGEVHAHGLVAPSTDFEWGAPSRVEFLSLFVKELLLLLGAADGGVQVTVALDHAHMERFTANFLQVSGQRNKP
ncbi:hypothetical protein EJB05_46329, partial [Eragrostis curvula]